MTREEMYATHFFGTALEWKLFFGALILGLVLGALYDVFRALRLSFKHPRAVVFVEDVLFVMIFGLSFYSYCTELCRGQIRFFILAAMLIGFAAYLLTLGRIVSKTVAKGVKICKSVLISLGKVFKKLLAILCGVPFFKESDTKIEETPCAEGEL